MSSAVLKVDYWLIMISRQAFRSCFSCHWTCRSTTWTPLCQENDLGYKKEFWLCTHPLLCRRSAALLRQVTCCQIPQRLRPRAKRGWPTFPSLVAEVHACVIFSVRFAALRLMMADACPCAELASLIIMGRQAQKQVFCVMFTHQALSCAKHSCQRSACLHRNKFPTHV